MSVNVNVINRPSVSGAVLQTPLSLFDWLSNSSFSSKSLRHVHSQTVWARDVAFLENVHLPPCVTCHMSQVMCHMSHVICRMSCVTCNISIFLYFKDNMVELVGGRSVINGAYPLMLANYICCLQTFAKLIRKPSGTSTSRRPSQYTVVRDALMVP